MNRVTRLDLATLSARYDERGYMYDSPVLTRTGVFEYRNDDGTVRREYRPPEEVFNADSLASFKGKPFTILHKKVTSENAVNNVIGTVLSDGREDGEENGHRLLRADVVLHSPQVVKDNGWKEVSVGYSVQLDETPGVTSKGEKYDAIQRNIRVDHVAVVPRGRAGLAKFNVDRADAMPIGFGIDDRNDDDHSETPPKDKRKVKVRLDNNLEYDAAPEVGVELERLRNDAAGAKKSLDTEKARADAAEAKLVEAEKEKAQLRKDAAASARRRIELETAAKEAGATIRDDATDRELQEAVIKSVRGDAFDLADKTDSYIDAAYDIARTDAEAKKRNDAAASQRSATIGKPSAVKGTETGARHDAGEEKGLPDYRANMHARRNDAWAQASKQRVAD